PAPSCPTARSPAGRPCSSSPTSTPATTPTRRCSGRPGRSPSARSSRGCASRSTTCPGGRWSPTSSTPWPSPPSRPRGSSMPRVLVVNTGSSSIKYQLFEMPEGSGEPRRGAPVGREGSGEPQGGAPVSQDAKVLASGLVERIGEAGAKLSHRAGDGDPLVVEERVADHSEGFERIFAAFGTSGGPITDLAGIGHRVVHGGDRLTEPTLIDDEAIAAIADQAPLAPLHNPSNLLGIRIAMA